MVIFHSYVSLPEGKTVILFSKAMMMFLKDDGTWSIYLLYPAVIQWFMIINHQIYPLTLPSLDRPGWIKTLPYHILDKHP